MTWWAIVLTMLAGGLWTVVCVLLGAAISTASAKQRQSAFEEIVNRQDWQK
jgi:Na+-translocating ferredoxin:NAD+ oxidoreductase RnfG subunit